METKKPDQEIFFSDHPLENPADDQLGRVEFAHKIAKSLSLHKDSRSFVIGIYGEWGEGKSSLMNFISYKLKELEQKDGKGLVVVSFNPWIFPEESALLREFFKTLAEAVGKALPKKSEKLGKWFRKYGDLIVSVTSFAPTAVSIGSTILTSILKRRESASVMKQKERIQEALYESEKRIVVFLDDIDRMDKTEVQAVFRLVKLTAAFDNISYVLAFDEKKVAACLNERYLSDGDDGGREFLEKIIQMPIYVPKVDNSKLVDLCFEKLNEFISSNKIELSKREADEFGMYFMNGPMQCLKTPRMIKRYLNAASFAVLSLLGEVNLVDLLLLEGVKISAPDLYSKIRDKKKFLLVTSRDKEFKEKEEGLKEIIDEFLAEVPSDKKDGFRMLLGYLFPHIQDLLQRITRDSSSDFESLYKQKKIASADHFDRYFLYGIPENDYSEQMLLNKLEEYSTWSIEQIKDSLENNIITEKNVGTLMDLLIENTDAFDEPLSFNFSLALASCAKLLPNPRGFISFNTPRNRAIFFIIQLLFKIEELAKRTEVAEKIIKNSTPLPFAITFAIRLKSRQNREDGETPFNDETYEDLEKIAANRVFEEAKQNSLYLEYGYESPSLYSFLENVYGKTEVSGILEKSFSENEKNVLEFLKTFSHYSINMSGVPANPDFVDSNYESVGKLIDPELIYERLKNIYGKELEGAEYKSYAYQDDLDKSFALQFTVVHERRKREAEGKN
jgi:hypothetical protein